MEENKYNPEGSPLREHQKKLLNLLIVFDRLCEENGIVWWIDGGTLLGAVRHGGFVPWDDDIDVCVLRKDLPRIRKILREKAPAPYAFKDSHSESDYTRMWPRFVDESCKVVRKDPATGKPVDDELWIDTFALRPGSSKFKKFVDKLYGRCARRIRGSIKDGTANLLLAYLLYPIALLGEGLVAIGGVLFHRDCLIHDFGVPFYHVQYPREIFPIKKIAFEGYLFPAPADVDPYLKHIYGDWTKLPPEEKRRNHEIIFPE